MKRHAPILSLALLVAAAAVTSPRSATGAPNCSTSGLVVWLSGPGDATAGSVYLTLVFTNQSGHQCTLSGYPGVSALDLHGKTLGSPASRDRSSIRTVRLANGATARARFCDSRTHRTSQASADSGGDCCPWGDRRRLWR